MNQLLLFVAIGLINFFWLAKVGMFQWGAFLLFLLIVLSMLSKVFGRAQSKNGKKNSKDE